MYIYELFLSFPLLLFPSLSFPLPLPLFVRMFLGTLPLDKSRIASIALVGPNGDATRTMQGNYYVRQGKEGRRNGKREREWGWRLWGYLDENT